MRNDHKPRKLKKGIYILPNLFTSLNMFCGFFAIIIAMEGNYQGASGLILLAVIFDILDGKIARATHTTSEFGVEYDSLADLISFGTAPAILMYYWSLAPLGRIGWLSAFLFLACGALRLARFNTQAGKSKSNHFQGLPIPAAAGMCATTVLFASKIGIDGEFVKLLILPMVYTLAFLMVSTVKYISFKKSGLFKHMGFNRLVQAILIMVFIAAQPAIALFVIAAVYVLSGIVLFIKHRRIEDITDMEMEEQEVNP